jgi:hypothetical protein
MRILAVISPLLTRARSFWVKSMGAASPLFPLRLGTCAHEGIQTCGALCADFDRLLNELGIE